MQTVHEVLAAGKNAFACVADYPAKSAIGLAIRDQEKLFVGGNSFNRICCNYGSLSLLYKNDVANPQKFS